MVITKGQFRWLVTAMFAAEIAAVIVSVATESALPLPLREYQAMQLEAESSPRETALTIMSFLIVTLIVAIVGLYCFWRFARPLIAIDWIVLLIAQVFDSPSVESGIVTSLDDLATLLNGIILAVIYMTPAREWFEGKKRRKKGVRTNLTRISSDPFSF